MFALAETGRRWVDADGGLEGDQSHHRRCPAQAVAGARSYLALPSTTGFLFGNRLLMLEHTGRNSGLRRYVVLEVVDHPRPTRWIVVSGFGERAQWFRNVCSNPQVRVDVGSRRPAPATATLLDDQAATKALQRYAVAHPRAWAYLRPVLEQTLGARIDQWAATYR